MKKITILILFLIRLNIHSQNIEVIYKYTTTFSVSESVQYYKLITGKDKSYFALIKDKGKVESKDPEVTIIEKKSGNEQAFVYKDFKKNIMIYNAPIFTKIFYVKESFPLQKWKIVNEFKEIAGKECQKATTRFRGRDYVAWFMPEVPSIDGPWKFAGLPGLIVEIYSTDGVLHITAESVRMVLDSDVTISKIPDDSRLISWEEYVKKYIKTKRNLQKSLGAKNDDASYNINIQTVEKIFEDE